MRYAILSGAALLLVVFLLLKNQPDHPDQLDPAPNRPERRGIPTSPHANDPLPPPLQPIRPAVIGAISSTPPPDYPARIAKAISENDLPAIQSATLSWFEQDPLAARDWLAGQPTLEDLKPAIGYIARRISEKGDLNNALEWAHLLEEETMREDTLVDIQALAIRNRRLAISDVIPDGISPARLEELRSGAAGD